MTTPLTPAAVGITGTLVTFTAADATGNTFTYNPRGLLLVKNGSGSSINVTVTVPGLDAYGSARPDPVVSVAAGAEKAIGPFPQDLVDPATGSILVTYSLATSVTVAMLSV